MARISIEVVCARVEEAVAAEQAGADRIELVSSVSAGGLTPSLGCVQRCLESVSIPVVPILRPREGGFCYSDSEFETMRRDLDRFLEAGVKEVSVGILRKDGRLDDVRLSQLMQPASGVLFMCHRAFDLTPDPFEALEGLASLGVKRTLTSGRKRFAREGTDALRQFVEAASGRVEIVAAGGIRSGNVREIVERSGVAWVHLGPTVSRSDPTSRLGSEVDYGEHLELDVGEVRAVREAVS